MSVQLVCAHAKSAGTPSLLTAIQTKEEVSQGQFEFSYGTVDTVAGPTLESTSNALATTLSGSVDICAFFSSCGIPLSRVCYATIHLVSKRIKKTLNYD